MIFAMMSFVVVHIMSQWLWLKSGKNSGIKLSLLYIIKGLVLLWKFIYNPWGWHSPC